MVETWGATLFEPLQGAIAILPATETVRTGGRIRQFASPHRPLHAGVEQGTREVVVHDIDEPFDDREADTAERLQLGRDPPDEGGDALVEQVAVCVRHDAA